MKTNKLIIGLAGEMAAGKTTVTDYLKKKYGAVSFRFSDMLRDILKRLHLPTERKNLQTISTALRQNFSEDLMSRVLTEDVKQSEHNFIITEGIRRPTDTTFLRDIPGFIMIGIEVDERTRYERIVARSENPDDQTKTWEEFQQEGKAETEQEIKNIITQADHVVDNNGTLEDLYKNIDTIIAEYYES